VNHELIIHFDECRGPELCHCCEAIYPGLVRRIELHGPILIGSGNLTERSNKISSLIVACPDRAIQIKPVGE
jgi:hypothetical protein